MEVFIIRHAEAIDRGAPIEDGHRPLTARGRRDARKLGRLLGKADVQLDALVTSPLVRAVESAELVAVGIDFDGELDVAPELGPSCDPMEVVREILLPRADLARVAVVGHQPQLGALAALLMHHHGDISPAKSSIIRLRWDGPEDPAKLIWILRHDLDAPSKDLADVES